ncbi:hypothetical protein PDR95_28525, partial [Bacillus cereus]|nr:hypothetical protein [Bacillus cereus]
LTRGGPRRAVFARWGYLWEFEGVEAHGQVNRGIKSVGRNPQKRAKTKVGLCKMISKDLDFL